MINNSRFLLLPDKTSPNLGSARLFRVAARLSNDWMERCGHPVLVVEIFTDPQLFPSAAYLASGWKQLGIIRKNQRVSCDYYEPHDRPTLLFVRKLSRTACRSLQAKHLKSAPRRLWKPSPRRDAPRAGDLKSLTAMLRQRISLYRNRRRCIYPVHLLSDIMAATHLADAPRGQRTSMLSP